MNIFLKNKILALSVLLMSSLLLHCSGGSARNDLPAGDWIKHGFSEEQREDLRSFFDEAVQNGDIAGGSLLLIHQDEVIFREAFGLADIETGRAFTTEDVCVIGSVTKSITATLMVILDERGFLSLDDPIKKWIPAFADIRLKDGSRSKHPPLIHQAMSHRSGLPGTADLGKVRYMLEGTLSEAVEALADYGLLAEPGTRFSYGSTNYRTVARIAEVATGQPLEELLKETVLSPLGMSHSAFRPTKEQLQRCPQTYQRTEEGLVSEQKASLTRYLNAAYETHGAKFSTLDEIGRYLLFHLNKGVVNGKRLVSAESLERMYAIPDQLPDQAYGLAWALGPYGPGQARHEGGSGTFVWLDFERDMAGVFFSQTRWKGNRVFRKRLMKKIRSVFEE